MAALGWHELLAEEGHALAAAAQRLADSEESDDLEGALDHNLSLWVRIRTLMEHESAVLPTGLRAHLSQLWHFVAQKTFEKREGIAPDALEILIETNRQVSQALLDGRDLPQG
ncbi:flagellar biosynthesis regulator FlaF [Pararhodospirillum photometricum]|uniref:Flagellar FlaF n=1 Tax=Pararhodospirillum photometricum DSM 122 TaxID=1150469 RepID=H6SME1_PARPM|nr:flagellar biosynthesis regulator FlaF [Pararhodospirillum photometricum]CCG06824.1 Putative uncharacterized protein [Pararhodospirillum photometricum DSM 122]